MSKSNRKCGLSVSGNTVSGEKARIFAYWSRYMAVLSGCAQPEGEPKQSPSRSWICSPKFAAGRQ